MRREFLLLLFILSSCATYQIPKQEVARLETLVKKGEIKKANLEEVFKSHEFPQLVDHFFYILYHLEQKNLSYDLDKTQLQNYFRSRQLKSLIPLHKLERIVHEGQNLTLYAGFSRSIPRVAELCLIAQEPKFDVTQADDLINFNVVDGSLSLGLNFPYSLVSSIDAQINSFMVYNNGTIVRFFGQYKKDGHPEKYHFTYFLKDGSYNHNINLD